MDEQSIGWTPEGDDEDEARLDDFLADLPPEARGEITAVPCAFDPEDGASVRRMGAVNNAGTRVAIATVMGDEETAVAVTPADARAFAAAILNAADEADGTVPLRFVPPGPDGR